MDVDQHLVDNIIAFIEERFPSGEAEGAAGMYTASGRLIVSTAPDTLNDTVSLCHETGCLCEAYTLNEQVTASACVYRERPGRYLIFAPCGVCQERLFLYGPNVSVAVADDSDPTRWIAKKLHELQPHYWRKALAQESRDKAIIDVSKRP
jgi:cytidine deaminase